MGAKSRRKGKAAEREIVALAREHGLEATRTWETAQAADPAARRCDCLVAGRPAQVKIAANGYKGAYDALEGVEWAFVRTDRQPWLAVLRAERLFELLARHSAGGEGGEEREGGGL